MPDDDLVEAYAAPEIYVDGFTNHTLRDGVMTAVGYRTMAEGRVIVVRLVWPAVNTNAAIEDAIVAMQSPLEAAPKKNGVKRVH